MPTLSLRTRLALAAGTLALVVLTAGAALAKPVAIVNGIDVPESDFAATLRAEAGRVVLTHMLGNAIIKDAFDKAGLTVSQKDLHDALVARFGSVERFKETATTNQVDEALYFSQVLTPQIMLEKLATLLRGQSQRLRHAREGHLPHHRRSQRRGCRQGPGLAQDRAGFRRGGPAVLA